ncbi:hypothetical protein B0T10DRAFT_555779 [Thelonectria olida]|uniref:Mid2 domain-containing protein n=1 Tax=Thelonectria olida TaxID=1576542 RepID=A0A9P8WI78_9HYPO|nr:hypothetical protein B0T10DRAFT_555779 [Thelonectria olida]
MNLGMARAEGVDRGVVNMNIQHKDSVDFSSAFNNLADGGSDDGGGNGNNETGRGGVQTIIPDPAGTTSVTNSGATSTAAASQSGNNNDNVGVDTSVPTSTAADTAAPSATSQSKSSGGGIGTGAIVGIVVGVVGGLLLIGAVAFFILRKRRQKKSAAGYDGADPANTYMVDKETQGRATDSPNSPYTDENQTRSVPMEHVTRDEPPAGIARTSTSLSQGRGGTSGAQTPQGVSSNVAHLVEDGMTADEIRRLEEEERQLDDEIERAARR